MTDDRKSPFQRNALAPGLIAAIILVVAPALFLIEWTIVVLYAVAILALIVGWFAWQARQWWWTIVFVAIAVIWNPIYPFGFEGWMWTAAQPVAAVCFIAAGALVKTPREQ